MKFSIETLLTAVTGRLLTVPESSTSNGMGDLYKIINHVLGVNVFTHQIPEVSGQLREELLRQFPQTQEAIDDLPSLDALYASQEDTVSEDMFERHALCHPWINKWAEKWGTREFDIASAQTPCELQDPISSIRTLLEKHNPEAALLVVVVPDDNCTSETGGTK